MRRVWQKRRCAVQAEGYLDICHADENKPPTRVNLLTCQIKLVPDDKRGFDLISCRYCPGESHFHTSSQKYSIDVDAQFFN